MGQMQTLKPPWDLCERGRKKKIYILMATRGQLGRNGPLSPSSGTTFEDIITIIQGELMWDRLLNPPAPNRDCPIITQKQQTNQAPKRCAMCMRLVPFAKTKNTTA